MLYNFIPKKACLNLRNYSYKGVTNSLSYEFIWSPLCNFLIKFTPEYIAPNLISFMVKFMIVIEIKSSACLLFFILQPSLHQHFGLFFN